MTCTHCRTSLTDWSAAYCPHSRPFCEACAWEEACEDCADPWLAGLNHVRARAGLEHLDEFPDAAYDPNCADYDSIAEDRAIRASDLTDGASDRAAERYYYGGRSA